MTIYFVTRHPGALDWARKKASSLMSTSSISTRQKSALGIR